MAGYISGYMKGARTEPDEKTTSAPKTSNKTTKGTSHQRFSCRRNNKNSLKICHMVRCH
jgi:hypothetical protein